MRFYRRFDAVVFLGWLGCAAGLLAVGPQIAWGATEPVVPGMVDAPNPEAMAPGFGVFENPVVPPEEAAAAAGLAWPPRPRVEAPPVDWLAQPSRPVPQATARWPLVAASLLLLAASAAFVTLQRRGPDLTHAVWPGTAAPQIAILAVRGLGQKHRLVLVEAAGERMLLTANDREVRLLGHLAGPELSPSGTTEAGAIADAGEAISSPTAQAPHAAAASGELATNLRVRRAASGDTAVSLPPSPQRQNVAEPADTAGHDDAPDFANAVVPAAAAASVDAPVASAASAPVGPWGRAARPGDTDPAEVAAFGDEPEFMPCLGTRRATAAAKAAKAGKPAPGRRGGRGRKVAAHGADSDARASGSSSPVGRRVALAATQAEGDHGPGRGIPALQAAFATSGRAHGLDAPPQDVDDRAARPTASGDAIGRDEVEGEWGAAAAGEALLRSDVAGLASWRRAAAGGGGAWGKAL